jgi:hypothetical protein
MRRLVRYSSLLAVVLALALGGQARAGSQGFLDNGGVFTTIEPPGSRDTFARGINGAGQIVGTYGAVNVKQFVCPFPRSLSRLPYPGRTLCTETS